ncbi:MAG: MauE/DoxX family redox-associated membrane protein [Acidimicrobiia bacterium]
MPLLSGPFLAISALLAVAGAMKVYRPKYTVGALRAAGLPANNVLVRLLGLAELGVGIAAIWTGAPLWAAAIGIFYLSFALFVVYALRSGIPIASCGCFGSPDTPPNVGHVVLDLTATAVALAVAIDPIGSWVGLPGVEPWTGVAFLLFSGAAVYLLYAIVNVLPQRSSIGRESSVRLSPTRDPVSE